MRIKKAVIPAAGFGTRFLPATKAQPKEMLPVVDKPAIQYIVEEAVNAGIEDILIVNGRFKRAIEDHFDRSMELEMHLDHHDKQESLDLVRGISDLANIHFIRQPEQLGLGHAILMAKSFVGSEPFAVLLGDEIIESETPAIKQLMNVYEKERSSVIGVREVAPEQVKSYGIVKGEDTSKDYFSLTDLVEKPAPEEAPSNLAIVGRYIIEPSIFELIETTCPGKNGEIQLTDALRKQLGQEGLWAVRLAGDRYDIGDKLEYIKASIALALKRDEMAGPLLRYLEDVVKSAMRV